MTDRQTNRETTLLDRSFTIGGTYPRIKRKDDYLYSAICIVCMSQSAQAWITPFYLQIHHACLSIVNVHQMAPPLTNVGDIHLQLTTHLLIRMDERLSWPGWLTYSGRFTNIGLSGHPPATGLAQDSKSSPAKDRRLLLCHATNCDVF